MGLRSRTLACAATRARQTQTTTACLQHLSGLYRSNDCSRRSRVIRRNLRLRIIANALTYAKSGISGVPAAVAVISALSPTHFAYPFKAEALE